jgi:putative ABC transport system permease protein
VARLILRGFLQRKLRVALTGIAIALGVALMAGTYILTDTINQSFAGIFKTAAKGDSVVVTPREALGNQTRAQSSPITEQMLARARATPGVAKAAGGIFTIATFLDVHRKRLTTGGAPAFVAGLVPDPFEAFKPIEGRYPRGPGETAIDQATSERSDLKLGDAMLIAGRAPAKRYTIVGIVKFGGGESFGGAGAALLIPAEAQRVVGEPGRFDQIDIAAAPGVTPAQLRARIRAVLPRSVAVRTGEQQAAKNTSDLEENLSFLRTFLLIFAYVALVVGAFIIFNTFSITVAQRAREFGLLRTLGASRRQIMREVIAEGLMLGVGGAVIGLFAGIGLAPALDALFKAFGADLPDSGTVLETRTIVVSLLVGTVVTVLAGLQPALRATRVSPLAAMREGVEIPPRIITGRGLLLRAGILVALVILAGALLSPVLYGVGFVVLAIYVTYLLVKLVRAGSPPRYRVVPAMARAIGALVAWRGITGRLAKENSMRQPGRTMVTAAALTVGIALVAFVAVFADGLKATIDRTVDRSFAGDVIIENSQGGGEQQGIPTGLAAAVESVPGVARVAPVAFTVGRQRGSKDNATITAIDPGSLAQVYRIEWERGSNATLAGLRGSGAIVSKSYGKSHHVRVGQTISVLTPANQRVSLNVLGVVDEELGGLLQDITVGLPLARSAFGVREDAFDFVAYAAGAQNARVQPAIDRLLASQFPQARSRTAEQFKQERAKQVNTLLTLIYVLLALSVIVSLFGIVNTLVLSIYERTRELGMMRAIGTSRRQVRQVIRYESVITSLIGGVLGLVVGVVAALLVAALALSGSGYIVAVPVGTLVVLLLVAAVAGVIAAQLPARRAARLDFLRAVTSE